MITALYNGIDEKFINADWAADNTLCIPIHHSLTNDELEIIVDRIKKFGNLN